MNLEKRVLNKVRVDWKTLWRTRPVFRWLVALEVIFLIAIAALVVSFVQGPPPLPFNSEIWDFAVGPSRFSMVQDLLSSGRLIGKTVEQMEKLLGTRACQRKIVDGQTTQLSYTMTHVLNDAYLDLDFDGGLCVGAQVRRPVPVDRH